MAVIGVMMADGKDFVPFQVTEETVRTLEKWKWSGKARWATHKRHKGDSLTEFVGRDPDSMSFTVKLVVALGVDPMKELERIWRWERNGVPLALTIGDHNYGRYRWSILEHGTEIQHTDAYGNIYACDVELKFQEYLRE